MTKTKNRLLTLFTAVIVLCLCVGMITACSGNSNYSVTFMVRENGADGEWQEYRKVSVNDDGFVTLPADPAVDGCIFRDWYTDRECTGDVFDGKTKISADTVVYALMVETEVTLNITDGTGNTTQQSETFANLSAITDAQQVAAAAVNLTFDGWYTDTAFYQKYADGVDTTALYGRYMAQITYDNGYETLSSELVAPGGKTTAPDGRVEGFVKRYMDGEDLSYRDSEGNAIDFAKDGFDRNEVVTVLWKTPGLEYKKIEGTDNDYYVSGITNDANALDYPAVSVLSENVTIDNGTTGNVVGVDTADLARYNKAEVVIFNEGIESVIGFYSTNGFMNASQNMKVIFPSTLKVLEDSFNGINVTSLTLPEGLEVIIDCFWSDILATGASRENGQNCTIVIPSTVTNMVAVPKNLDLSENDRFEYDEEGRLYYAEGGRKILCSEYQSHVDNGRISVKEGVTGVQVYLLSTMNFDYLDLPSTFCEVGYNNAAENYPAYTGNLLTPQSVINNPEADPASGANKDSYAVVSNLEKITYVAIARTDLPVSDFAFISSSGVPHNGSQFENDVKVVLVGNVPAGGAVEIVATVSYSRDSEVRTQKLTGYRSGDALSVQDVLEAVQVSADDYNVMITNVGKTYEGGTIASNLYITIECYSKAGGFTYTVNADGKTATVTGVDLSTAEMLTDGSYRVIIDMTEGYIMTAIADGAFKNAGGVSEVYIANTVKTIGEEAFMNASNLRLVDIAPGGLETIGKSAFENAGCVQNADGSWVVNAEGGVSELTMKLPLADLTDILPYAFKTKAIKKFTAVKEEEDRSLLSMLQNNSEFTAGMYVFASNGDGSIKAIVRYMEAAETKQMLNSTGENVDVTVHDVQLVATAGGATYSSYSTGLSLGFTYRPFDSYFAEAFPELVSNVFCYEVMEGSVYFGGGSSYCIYIGLVSKIHKNAFTDMNADKFKVYYYNCAFDQYLTLEQLKGQDPDIFEEGWFNGRANSENTFMEIEESDQLSIPVM